jgi:hypothetical protein
VLDSFVLFFFFLLLLLRLVITCFVSGITIILYVVFVMLLSLILSNSNLLPIFDSCSIEQYDFEMIFFLLCSKDVTPARK